MNNKIYIRIPKSVLAVVAALMCGLFVLTFLDILPDLDDFYLEDIPAETVSAITGDKLAVDILSVGQGDCTVISLGGYVFMIDAGERSSKDEILAYLERNEIDSITGLFITHPHADHIGSMCAVLDSCDVGEIWFADIPDSLTPATSTYANILKKISDMGKTIEIAEPGDKIKFGGAVFTVLSSGEYDDLNNCSIVIRLDYGETSFLFMGDAVFDAENNLLENGMLGHVNVLKSGHHGSAESTSTEFLNAVSPDYVVCSCGVGNDYDFPRREYLERVEKCGARLLRTDICGNVSFVSDGVDVYYCPNDLDAAA